MAGGGIGDLRLRRPPRRGAVPRGGERLRRAAPQPARHLAPDRGLRRAARLSSASASISSSSARPAWSTPAASRSPCPIAASGAALFGIGTAWVGYRFGDRAVLASSFARPVERRGRLPERQAAHERGRGDGDRRRPADAARVPHRRARPERVRDRPRPGPRVDRGHDGPPEDDEPGRAAGRDRPRDVARAEPRHPEDDPRRRAARRGAAPERLGDAPAPRASDRP